MPRTDSAADAPPDPAAGPETPAAQAAPAGGGRLRALLPDLAPWRSSRDFRLMWLAGVITTFGSFLTMVALPVPIKDLTGSAAAGG